MQNFIPSLCCLKMISLHISTLFVVLVTICNCYGDKRHGQEHIKECLDGNGLTREKYFAFKKEYLIPQKIDDTPKELCCAMKCIDEKKGNLKDGKFEISKLKKHIAYINFLKTPEEYLKCLEVIDIKECEDYRKKFKCDLDVGFNYLHECSSKLKVNNDNITQVSEGGSSRNKKKGFCVLKCALEGKGVIDKDGKMVESEAAKDILIMSEVKDKESFLNCLKGLEIKVCEDIAKIWSCKKKQG